MCQLQHMPIHRLICLKYFFTHFFNYPFLCFTLHRSCFQGHTVSPSSQHLIIHSSTFLCILTLKVWGSLQVRWRARCVPVCVWTGRRWRRWPAAFCPAPCCEPGYSRIRCCCRTAPATPPGCRTGSEFHRSEEEMERKMVEEKAKRRKKRERKVGRWWQKRNLEPRW